MKRKLTTSVLLIAATLFATSVFCQNENMKPAKLIVYRKGCAYGLLANFKVKEDDKQLGSLGNQSIHSYEVKPGSHMISPRQAHRAITVDMQPGKTYVVKYQTRVGIFGARPKLKLMTVEEAEADSKLFKQHMNDKMGM